MTGQQNDRRSFVLHCGMRWSSEKSVSVLVVACSGLTIVKRELLAPLPK